MRGKFLFSAASAAVLAACFAGAASAQTADPAADVSTNARINPGESVSGELAPAGDSDWYRLTVRPGLSYQINLDGVAVGETPAIDPVLIVHSAGGDEIASNDDSGESLNSSLRYRPTEAAEVFLEARAFMDSAVGPYTLRVEAAAIPPDDAGDDPSTNARLSPGQSATGVIGDVGDTDWYRLSARSGQLYRLSLNSDASASSPLGDPLLRVVDADGNELASNDDSNESLNSYLEFTPARSGDIFVVAGAFNESIGAYNLQAEATRLPPDNAGNGDDTRARLYVGNDASGGLDYPGDRDWFRVRLNGGETYRFTLASAEGERQFDPLVRIYDADANELAVDDDGGPNFDSYLEFTAPADGEYFVEARGFDDNAVGDYTLAALSGDIPADASTDASLSADGDYRDGMLSPAGDSDWFRIDLNAGQSVRIGVNSVEGPGGGVGDPLIVLHGADGAELVQDDDGGDGLNSWLEYTAATNGPHYLEVRGFMQETAQGRYSIALTPGEIGADAETAEPLTASFEGRASVIGAPDDVDWFLLELVEGRSYRFNLDSTEFDPMLTLLNSEGVQVALDDDGGAGANAYLTYVPVAGGPHYAAVSSYNASSQGAYMLRVTDTDVPGNTGTDENLAAEGDDRLSSIDFVGDLDFYRVELQAGMNYIIDVSGDGDNPLPDPFLTVLNSNGESLATDDDGGDGLNARLRFTPENSDVYYLQASGLGAGLGAYRISVAPQGAR